MEVLVTVKVSPMALEIIKWSLFAYERMLELNLLVNYELRDKIKARYGTALEDDLPMPLSESVKKVRISLH